MAVDERVETEIAQPVGQALAVGYGLDAVLREPSVTGLSTAVWIRAYSAAGAFWTERSGLSR